MKKRAPWIEIALAAAVVLSFAHTIWWFATTGYLPQPFVFDTNDTYMDWFNVAYWAHRPGIYDVWRSIYPPLSFLFLDFTTLPGCYTGSPFHARDCDWLAHGVILGFYLFDVALVWIALKRTNARTALPRTIAVAFGLPLLFTLERGNVILVAFAAFVVAYGPIARTRRGKALATAVTINFKPYLVLPALAAALRRDWRPLELAGIATVLLYLVTLAWVGAGSPAELAANTANWVTFVSGQVWNEVNYSTSYAPFLLMRDSQLPLLDFVPSRLIEGIEAAVPVAIRSAQFAALAALGAAWLQPRALSETRIGAIILGAYLATQSPGGYTQLFLIFLVLLEPWKGGAIVAIAASYALCLVGDWPLATVLKLETVSWLSGRPVRPEFGLTLGHFVRPGLVILIVWALAIDAIARVARAHLSARPVLGLTA